MKPNAENGIIQARFTVPTAAKQELIETAIRAHTDITNVVRGVLLGTRGQWLHLYAEYMRQVSEQDFGHPPIKIAAVAMEEKHDKVEIG